MLFILEMQTDDELTKRVDDASTGSGGDSKKLLIRKSPMRHHRCRLSAPISAQFRALLLMKAL